MSPLLELIFDLLISFLNRSPEEASSKKNSNKEKVDKVTEEQE